MEFLSQQLLNSRNFSTVTTITLNYAKIVVTILEVKGLRGYNAGQTLSVETKGS